MAPRQIIITMPDRAGGLPNVIRNILMHRNRKDFRYHLVLIDELSYQGLRIYENMNAESITRLKYVRDDNLYLVCKKIGRIIKGFGNKALLVTNGELDLHMASICRLNNPLVHICHGDNDFVYQTAQWYASIVDHFVSVSRFIGDQLATRSWIGPGRISYIPHPIPLSDFKRIETDGKLRIVFVGRLVSGKGIFHMPEIEKRLRNRGVAVEWNIIGDGIERAGFERRWPQNADVNWIGEVRNSDVFKTISHGDIFLLPSYAEGFPLVVAEAMGAGLVPVVSDLKSGLPEIVEEGRTGFLCPVGDIEKMTDAIFRLHHDRRMLAEISDHARQKVKTFFDPELRAGEYEDLFMKILEMPMSIKNHPGPLKTRIIDQPFIPSAVTNCIRRMVRISGGTKRRMNKLNASEL